MSDDHEKRKQQAPNGPNGDGADRDPGEQRGASSVSSRYLRRFGARAHASSASGCKSILRRVAVDRHGLAQLQASAQIKDAGLARAYRFEVGGGEQPLRQDVFAQLGSRRAQQLVQAARAEQIQIVAVNMMLDIEACAAGAFAAPSIVQAIQSRLIKIRRAPCQGASIAYPLVIHQQGDKSEHRERSAKQQES